MLLQADLYVLYYSLSRWYFGWGDRSLSLTTAKGPAFYNKLQPNSG